MNSDALTRAEYTVNVVNGEVVLTLHGAISSGRLDGAAVNISFVLPPPEAVDLAGHLTSACEIITPRQTTGRALIRTLGCLFVVSVVIAILGFILR